MRKAEELAFMEGYAENMNPDVKVEKEQFIALFTAYCLHHDIELDTAECDELVEELFKALPRVAVEHWGGYGIEAQDRFYSEIGKNLC